MPKFSDYQTPKIEKEISEFKIDTDSNPLSDVPESKFILRLRTYFSVQSEGAYRFYILFGAGDLGMVKIDKKFMARIECPAVIGESTPTTFDALLPMGGHEIVVEYANTGYANKIRVAYQGPDTKGKPRPIKPVDVADVEMGYPAELSKSQKVITRPATTTQKIVTTRSSIPRAPWGRAPSPPPRPNYRVPTPPPVVTTTVTTSAPTTEKVTIKSVETDSITERRKSFKVIIGTVFGVMAGLLAAVIIFKFF